MGFFSNKTVCTSCGKSFSTIINEFDGICPKCAKKQEKETTKFLSEQGEIGFLGLFPVARGVRNSINIDACKAQLIHRNDILEAHRNNDAVSLDEIQNINANFMNLNEQQKEDAARRVMQAVAWKIQDHYLCNGILMNTGLHAGVTIDLSKVAAIAVNTNMSYGRGILNSFKNNISVVGLVTNDPFMPFYRIILGTEPRFWGGNYSKTANQNLNDISLLQSYCPNLRSDIIDSTQLRNVLSRKIFNDLQPNIDYMNIIDSYSSFEITEIDVIHSSSLPPSAKATSLIRQYGYIDEDTLTNVLAIKNGRSNTPLGNYILGYR